MDKISVIMSVYNEKEEWLKKAIESILNQTYQNLEFIIVLDDPNNNKLNNIIKEYSHQDKRIKYFVNSVNRGLTYSLNFALSKVNGDYIARMDADDISLSTRLERQLDYIKLNDIDLLGCNIVMFEENIIIDKTNFLTNREDILKKILIGNNFAHSTWLVKRNVYNELHGYRDMFACEDYDFILRACSFGFNVQNMGEYLLEYRINPKGVSQTKLLQQKYASNYISENYFRINDITDLEVKKYLEHKNITEKKKLKFSKALKYHEKFKKTRNYLYILMAVVLSYDYLRIYIFHRLLVIHNA